MEWSSVSDLLLKLGKVLLIELYLLISGVELDLRLSAQWVLSDNLELLVGNIEGILSDRHSVFAGL